MTPRHLIRRAAEADFGKPTGWATAATGYREWSAVGEAAGAVHTGFEICELEPGGALPAHVHSFEETFYVLSGSGVLETTEGTVSLGEGEYGLAPVGVAHGWRNGGDAPVRWAQMQGPQPRARFGGDTFLVPPLPARDALPVDVRDPRTRRAGRITPAQMDVGRQQQNVLEVSASMRTALLVYSGITVKMMVDSDLGARLTTMFMVQYEPAGVAGLHDRPFEETYLILDGSVDAQFDGEHYRLSAGDLAWAGAGCVHGFANPADVPVRWLETQAPQPPGRHSYRFARDWEYLRDLLARNGGDVG
jgi:quercetin dioxygenase-like cupin family protein